VNPICKGKRIANDVPNHTVSETESKKTKKSTEVQSNEVEVINVDELDFPPQPPPSHLFVFPESLSGEEKLDAIMPSKFVIKDKYSDFPICYKDFQKYRDKKFMMTSVVSGFFKLLNIYLVPFMNHQ
jgi:hypothetical protein